jgi:hypothetical protein
MKNLLKSIAILTLLFISNDYYSQCSAPDKTVKVGREKAGFGVCTQSKSGALTIGETYEMAFIAQANMDYKIVAGLENEAVGTLEVELFEMVTDKDKEGNYVKVKKTVAKVGALEAIDLTTDKTRKLMIGVTIKGKSEKPECIAVLILDKKTTKLGL